MTILSNKTRNIKANNSIRALDFIIKLSFGSFFQKKTNRGLVIPKKIKR